jgi:branched-chain amino acid transport system substrate-binding protein
VIGGVSPDAPYLTNPDFYPSGSQLLIQTIGTFNLAKAAGKKHIGVLYCAESPICAQLVPLSEGIGKLDGLAVTTAKVSSTAPSYTPNCLALKTAGVDSLFVGAASPIVQRVTAACAQQGYTPQTVSQASTFSGAWLSQSSFDKALLSGYNANPYDASTPAIQQLQAALDKYAPGLTTSSGYNYDVVGVWAGAQLFAAAAKAGNIGPTSTPADMKKGLYALKNATLGGLSGPLNFTAGKPAFVPCYFTEQIEHGKLASLNGDKPTCLTPAQAGAIVKSLHL